MASRTESKARQAMSEMYDRHAEIEPGQLAWVGLDLSDLKTVVAAANHVKANETRLPVTLLLTWVCSQQRVRHHGLGSPYLGLGLGAQSGRQVSIPSWPVAWPPDGET